MKRFISMIFALALLTVTGYAQEPDTVVTIPGGGGFSEFYEKYSVVIWTLLGLLGVTAFLQYRFVKLKAAFDKLVQLGEKVVRAAEDGRVTESEFQDVVKGFKEVIAAFKEVWSKKK